MTLLEQQRKREIKEIGFEAVKIYTRIYEVLGYSVNAKGKKRTDAIKLRFLPTKKQIEIDKMESYTIDTPIPIKVHFENEIIYCKA